jgi:hypothetical protein
MIKLCSPAKSFISYIYKYNISEYAKIQEKFEQVYFSKSFIQKICEEFSTLEVEKIKLVQ